MIPADKDTIARDVESTVYFPIRIFTQSLAGYLHRSRFLRDMADLYDTMYEECRQKLNELDPETERPPIKRGATLDMSAIDNALSEEN